METKDKILIVEDDETIAAFLIAVLEANGFDTIRASLGREAVTLISSHCPDLVLLDLSLPDMDGMEILAGLRKWSTLPVIVVSARGRERDKVIALDMGADDYLSKPFGIMELVSRVKALIRRAEQNEGSKGQDSQIIEFRDIRMDDSSRKVTISGEEIELTYKEYELLKYLMLNANIVMARDRLLSEVWGFDYEGESRTVDMHIKTLRQKLGDAGKYIKTIRSVGYMIGD